MRQVRPPQVIEIHRQERHFGGNVGAAEARAELDAIEEVDLPSAHEDAVGVQVAVTVPNPASPDPLLEQRLLRSNEALDIAAYYGARLGR